MISYRALILLFLSTLLFSCGQRNKPQSPPAATATASQTNAYQKYVNSLDSTDAATATLAAKKYQELFSNTDTLINDKAYAIFEKYYTRLMFGLNEHFRADAKINKIPSTLVVDKPATYPPLLAQYAEVLKTNGFEFIAVEGDVEISQDRDFITKWFYPSVSATMKKYLDEENKENKEGLAEDDALIISTITLSDRAIWWENFTASYPHFSLIDEALLQKKLYLTFLLKGLDNSPILNYDSHHLTEFYKAAYMHLISKYPEASATKMVKPFYEALLANDTAKATKITRQYSDEKLLLW